MLDIFPVTLEKLTGDRPRRAYVYVPDAALTHPGLRFPVLYMFDGHNLFYDHEATYGKSWGIGDYLDATQAPLIVAAVECNHDPDGARLVEYCPFTCYFPGYGDMKGKGKRTMDFFVNEFKPYIDGNYPTLPDREHTFLAGSSMGGLMTLYGVVKYNKVFSRGAALSPSVWFAQDQIAAMVEKSRIKPDTVLYMDYGQREMGFHKEMLSSFSALAKQLLEKKVNLTCRIVPHGNHNEASWEKQLPFFIHTLLYDLEG